MKQSRIYFGTNSPRSNKQIAFFLKCANVLTGEQLRKGAHLVEADTDLPPFFDTFDDYREFCLEYRASLGKIARLTACLLPEPALAAASRRLSSSLGLCSVSGASLEVCTFLLVATCYLLPKQHRISATAGDGRYQETLATVSQSINTLKMNEKLASL